MYRTICIAVILSCGCQDSDNSIVDRESLELLAIELIDTFRNELQLDTATSVTTAEFHPMYIGEIKDSIVLSYSSGANGYLTFDWGRFRHPDISDLSIFVDTTQTIGSVSEKVFLPPPPPPSHNQPPLEETEWKIKPHRGRTTSYPVIIKNRSTDTLMIGYGAFLPMVIEAQDSLGIWRAIQEPFFYWCGTGLTCKYLPPDDVAISSCKLFEGDYETKMRLVFGWELTMESNEFIGSMNYAQFDNSGGRSR